MPQVFAPVGQQVTADNTRYEGGNQPWPVGTNAQGQTIYSDGSVGWTKWSTIGNVAQIPDSAKPPQPQQASQSFGSSALSGLQQSIDKLTGQLSSAASASPPTPILPTFDPKLFEMPSSDEFLKAAANDPTLVKYYQDLIDQSGGDLNVAKQRLEQDYQRGVRQTTEDVTRETGYAKEDLKAALEDRKSVV